jgi:biotin carboxyl carrier protein
MEATRMTHPRNLTVRIEHTTATVALASDGSIVVRADTADTAETETSASYLGHGRVRLINGSDATLAHVVDDGDKRWVFVNGAVFEVEVEDVTTLPRRRGARTGHESLSAPMPATVVRIAVAVGQAVTRGTALVILEAMKMELPLRAPHDAVVKAIRCAEGDLVQPGAPLVDLDEQPVQP